MRKYIVMGRKDGQDYRASTLLDTRKEAKAAMKMREIWDTSYVYRIEAI